MEQILLIPITKKWYEGQMQCLGEIIIQSEIVYNTIGGWPRNKRAILPKSTNSYKNRIFQQMLSDFQNRLARKIKIQSTGLTATDYLTNPFHSKFHMKRTNILISQKTKSIQATQDHEFIDPKGRSQLSEPQIIEKSVNTAASKYNLPPNLIKAVIKAESNFNAQAVSIAGAQGLMQLMPTTAEELGVENPFDIDQNVDGGSRYLKKMIDRFGGDIKLALAAYNAGPGTVERYKGDVPYRETKRFVNRVLRFSGQVA